MQMEWTARTECVLWDVQKPEKNPEKLEINLSSKILFVFYA